VINNPIDAADLIGYQQFRPELKQIHEAKGRTKHCQSEPGYGHIKKIFPLPVPPNPADLEYSAEDRQNADQRS